MTYQGLLLAAGKGIRLADVTNGATKALIPVGDESLVEHNLRRLVDVGCERVVVVVGYRSGEVAEHLRNGPYAGLIELVHQEEALGTGHAVAISRDALRSEPFILCYCDNYTPYRMAPLLKVHREQHNIVSFALFRAEDPTRHGIMEIEGDHIVNIVERPTEPVGNMAFAGMGVFEADIYDAVEKVKRSKSGEYYLTDAVMDLVRAGHRVGYDVLEVLRVNVNSPDELELAREYSRLHS